jgi:hypothetical protein
MKSVLFLSKKNLKKKKKLKLFLKERQRERERRDCPVIRRLGHP